MWTQYSREQPARRGRTLATLSLAFIGTVVVAYVMVERRTLSGRQCPAGWPIAFTLPDAYDWHFLPDARRQRAARTGSSGIVTYVGQRDPRVTCNVLIGYASGSGARAIGGTAGGFGLLDQLLGSREIAVGPLAGRMVVRSDEGGETRMYAQASTRGDLNIEVLLLSEGAVAEEFPVFEAICGSIEIVDRSNRVE